MTTAPYFTQCVICSKDVAQYRGRRTRATCSTECLCVLRSMRTSEYKQRVAKLLAEVER